MAQHAGDGALDTKTSCKKPMEGTVGFYPVQRPSAACRFRSIHKWSTGGGMYGLCIVPSVDDLDACRLRCANGRQVASLVRPGGPGDGDAPPHLWQLSQLHITSTKT